MIDVIGVGGLSSKYNLSILLIGSLPKICLGMAFFAPHGWHGPIITLVQTTSWLDQLLTEREVQVCLWARLIIEGLTCK